MPHRFQQPIQEEIVDDTLLREKIALQSVIIKIKGIATNQYENKLSENILAIFNHLSKEEKKVYLRSLSNILTIVESSILFDKQELDSIRTGIDTSRNKVENEADAIEKTNELELIKLKTLGVKAVGVFLVLGTTAIVGIWSLFKGERLSEFSFLVKLKKVFFEIIGL